VSRYSSESVSLAALSGDMQAPSAGPELEVPRFPQVVGAAASLESRITNELRERALELSRLCRRACALHGIEIELQGTLPDTPAVYVANHLGYIDPVVLCSILCCSPVAKSEIRGWPWVGGVLERLNVTFVRRGSPHSGARVLRQCLRTLEAGVSVLNFPEGTTSRGSLLPFHLGAFWLARRARLPLVPVAVDFERMDMCWVDDEAFVPHYFRMCLGKLSGKPQSVRISIGDALDAASFRSEIDLCFAAQRAIASLRRPYIGAAA
jgi:1-acyl-sn-glycerol-3-phosphate acyltransferase